MKENKFSKIIIFSSILFLVALIYSCNSSITNPTTDKTITDFPNKIGDEWKYFYYDSLSSLADTVIVSIVGDTTFNTNRTAKVWKYQFRDGIEYHFVEILNDTVRIYDYLETLWDNTKFVFPLKVGKGWKGDFVTDTSSIIKRESISVLAGHFEDSYLIKEEWDGPNEHGHVLTSFVPRIGIVKKLDLGFSFGSGNKNWELMEYMIK